MSGFLERIERAIADGRLIAPGQAVVVAVSGGIDSMVLLNVLAKLGSARRWKWKLSVAHLNHRLRGRSSDADERLVRNAAKLLDLPFIGGSADVKRRAREDGVSLEMAARRCRHEFFAHEAKARGIRRIALAHHADDQVELFFLRLLRGAGMQGLAGMRRMAPAPGASSVKFIRPLLECTRAEIDSFSNEAGIRFREDASNASTEILRNRVRHELLPFLRDRFQPGLNKVVLRQMEILAAENEVMLSEARAWCRGTDLRFDALPAAIQRRVLQLQLERISVAPDFDLIETMRKLPGKAVSIARDLTAMCDESGTVVVRRPHAEQGSSTELVVSLENGGGGGDFGGLCWKWKRFHGRGPRPVFAPGSEWFDAERVGRRVILRYWRAGDRFQPIGMRRSQKLQDLFTNLKVPRLERRHRVVATTDSGSIWWVEGLRIGELYKLGPETRKRLKWSWARPGRNSTVQELPGWTDKLA